MFFKDGEMVTELFGFSGNSILLNSLINEQKVVLCEHCGGFNIRLNGGTNSISLFAKQGEKKVIISKKNTWLKPGHKLFIDDEELTIIEK